MLVIIRIVTRMRHRTIMVLKWWSIIQRTRMRRHGTIVVMKGRWISLGRVWIWVGRRRRVIRVLRTIILHLIKLKYTVLPLKSRLGEVRIKRGRNLSNGSSESTKEGDFNNLKTIGAASDKRTKAEIPYRR